MCSGEFSKAAILTCQVLVAKQRVNQTSCSKMDLDQFKIQIHTWFSQKAIKSNANAFQF
jgi:hypothetical protein